MAAWQCTSCTATYSVGAPRCPQCGATDHIEEGQHMPKITRHGGPTTESEGSEQPSAGSNSQTSTEPQPRSRKTKEHEDPSPARTTGSRSPKGRTGSSTAATTDGDQTAVSSDADHK